MLGSLNGQLHLPRVTPEFLPQPSMGSRGTRMLSISGDCSNPGIYEIEFGTSLKDVLRMAGGEDAIAVQVGGASGRMVAPMVFDRKIDYDDLPTGGSIMVFGPGRDIVKIVDHYMEFFVEESCGFCVPCRVGNVLVKQGIEKVLAGDADEDDLDALTELCKTVKSNSRCGLGQASTNSVMRSLRNFRPFYQEKLKRGEGKTKLRFDVVAALNVATQVQGRKSDIFGRDV